MIHKGLEQKTPLAQDFRRCVWCQWGFFAISTWRGDVECPECEYIQPLGD